jgi:hypothetical protein
MSMADFAHQPGWALLVSVSHLAAGTGFGLLYFHAMWRSVRFLAGGTALKAAVIAMAARFAILSGVLVLTSLEGAVPLLATALGVMAGRFLVIRGVRSQPA